MNPRGDAARLAASRADGRTWNDRARIDEHRLLSPAARLRLTIEVSARPCGSRTVVGVSADVPLEPERIVAALNAAGVGYVIVGGLAAGERRRPRDARSRSRALARCHWRA